MKLILLLSIFVLSACEAVSKYTSNETLVEFENVLAGYWDEGHQDEMDLLCAPGRSLLRHQFSKNLTEVKWIHESEIQIYDDSFVKESIYNIEYASNALLALSLQGEKRLNSSGDPYIWELVMVNPGMYRWRSSDWPVGRYNKIWGKRCR